jgi:hypothetical protein
MSGCTAAFDWSVATVGKIVGHLIDNGNAAFICQSQSAR